MFIFPRVPPAVCVNSSKNDYNVRRSSSSSESTWPTVAGTFPPHRSMNLALIANKTLPRCALLAHYFALIHEAQINACRFSGFRGCGWTLVTLINMSGIISGEGMINHSVSKVSNGLPVVIMEWTFEANNGLNPSYSPRIMLENNLLPRCEQIDCLFYFAEQSLSPETRPY